MAAEASGGLRRRPFDLKGLAISNTPVGLEGQTTRERGIKAAADGSPKATRADLGGGREKVVFLPQAQTDNRPNVG